MASTQHLVLDSSGFIRAVDLRSLFSEAAYTVPEVVEEIKDKATRERMKMLPFDLVFRRPSAQGLHAVSEVAKRTGDFASLSATDLKLLALTYDLELEHVGSQHLRLEPRAKTRMYLHNKYKIQLKKATDGEKNDGENKIIKKEEKIEELDKAEFNSYMYWRQPIPDVDVSDDEGDESSVAREVNYAETSPAEDEGVVLQNEDENDNEYDDDQEEEEEEDDSDGDWITPSNLRQKQLEYMGVSGKKSENSEKVAVACLTTDFAMQNVLKQMNLRVLALNGMLVRHTRTWQLRCTACFKLTKADKINKFCPWCGNKTLKRVAVTLKEDGTKEVHINVRRPLNVRGKKFSLPKPQGGKHALNPMLSADQRGPDQRASKKALQKTNALHSDYIAGESPFALRDVNSRSAKLGVPGAGHMATAAYWDRSNPNASRRPTGNRKKKRN